MKRIFITLFTMVLFTSTVQAASPIKNYYGYTLIDNKLQDIVSRIDVSIQNERGITKLNGTPNAYYAVYNNEHYYMKLYPANADTNIYIVADTAYDKDNNTITQFFSNNNIKYKKLDDKTALQEYQFDFVDYARTGELDGLFIMPDYIKPLKTGMGKLNDKLSKNSKKTSAIEYSKDTEPIDLTCVNSETYTDENAQVTVKINEYRLKNKQNKYVHAYEYLVTNNSSTNIVIDKVTSERVASMKDITTQTFVDLDRLDLADTIGSFPPVAICTCGTSLIFTVANNVRLAKVAKESIRYAHNLPQNYTIKPNDTMRILTLKFKNDPKPLDFTATKNGMTYRFSY